MSLFEEASLVITPNGFKAGKLYTVKPDFDTSGTFPVAYGLDVTRATSATRVNANGIIETVGANVPRIDYTGGGCPSILVEPQRTNLLTYSEDFTNASWTKLNATITSNVSTAPDNTSTADKLVEDNTSNNHLVQIAIVATDTTYSFSIFAKKAERNWIVLRSVNASFQNVKAWFNIDTGTIGTLENGATATITSLANGWYKCTMVVPSFSSGFEFRVSVSTGNNVDSYLGDGTSGVYLWGAQLEAGSYATSYIPTTSASVTRNADVISKTGISDLIGQTEGTLFCDVNLNSRVSFTYLALSTDLTTSSNYLGIGFLGNSIAFESVVGAALQANIVYSNSSTGRFKIAAAYKANDFVLYINGVQIGTDTSGTIPACSQLGLNAFSNAQALNYNSVQLYKKRLTNDELVSLTTI
jgi:hypothetical protein